MKALILFFFSISSFSLFARDELNMHEFKVLGEALIEVTLFKIDVYTAKLYQSNSLKNVTVLELDYMIDVDKKYSLQGWKEGFKPINQAKYKAAIDWIFENTIDLNKGDKFSIWKSKNEVRFYHNLKLVAQIKDPFVNQIALYPWIGENPLDQEMKNKLLGLNKEK